MNAEFQNMRYGKAIDINPKINPFVDKNGFCQHENALKYVSRKLDNLNQIEKEALITKSSQIYKIFKKYNWDWGGDWSDYKDYQHFEKI